MTYRIGDRFKLTSDAVDNYGEDYAGKVFTVRAVYTHYVPAANMASDPTGHPGFDGGSGPLYGSNELDFDVYGWEMERAA